MHIAHSNRRTEIQNSTVQLLAHHSKQVYFTPIYILYFFFLNDFKQLKQKLILNLLLQEVNEEHAIIYKIVMNKHKVHEIFGQF